VISAFHIVHKHLKKNKCMHIQDIQAFQIFFQTVYDPLHLSQTVYYVAKTLRDKIKFPSLPTSKLALAFRPPYPKWLPCESLLGMKQCLITKEKDKVTPARCNLYTFRGRLHIDLHHVRIVSLMGIGTKS